MKRGRFSLAAYAAAIMIAGAAMTTTAIAQEDPIEQPSSYGFEPTVDRITAALQGAGMTIFARIDHRAAAQTVGLQMPPTVVLIYGNPKGGTPLMNQAPALALDLPLRVLVHEDASGKTQVAFHDAFTLTRPRGIADDKAQPLRGAQALIAKAISAP
jgi:uncharacterized protein (DUF302 family)